MWCLLAYSPGTSCWRSPGVSLGAGLEMWGGGCEGVECCGLLGWRRETASKGDRKNEIQIGGRG